MTDTIPELTAAGIYDYQSNYELEYHREAERAFKAETERDDLANALRRAAAELTDSWAALNGTTGDAYDRGREAIVDSVYDALAAGVEPDQIDYAALASEWVQR